MSVLEHRKQLLPRNFKVFIDTELVKDTFVIKCPRDPEAAETFNVERILEEIRIKYEKWHAFPVFEFQLCLNEQQQPLQKTSLLQSIIADPNGKFASLFSLTFILIFLN